MHDIGRPQDGGGREARTAGGAFTLIELLVVIAVISLLLTILMPSLQRARALARVAICMSNLRNGAMSVHLYANDYDGVAPQACSHRYDNSYPIPYWFTFYGDAYALINDPEFHCPEVGRQWYAMVHPTEGTQGAFEKDVWSPPLAKFNGIRLERIPDQGNYALLMDSAMNVGGDLQLKLPPFKGGKAFSPSRWYNSGGQRHNVWLAHEGLANGAFADGHVESISADGLLEVSNYNKAPELDHRGIDTYWTHEGVYVNWYSPPSHLIFPPPP
jgi:prepilin-type N-terminal cleavage/methylation domain-containing protein/prepilin-type processing-associated H-X9-DG protein